jgi:cytochrome c
LVTVFGAAGAMSQVQTKTEANNYPGIGRPATPAELAAWDIAVRPDFRGLPKGAGSVAQGTDIWEAKCASCHGVFGESNEVFAPLVGGTTQEDVKTGRVARLNDPAFPGRTTLMKLSTLSTLWDYIHRAMPWNAPKSLSNDEVYAVTAYLLNLGGVVPDNFTLSSDNMAQVQQWLPNRNGTTTDHGLWPGKGLGHPGRPDVHAQACMHDCRGEPQLASFLPEHARNAHGNLALQNRGVGAQRGVDTAAAPAGGVPLASGAALATPSATPPTASAKAVALLKQHGCVACHGMNAKIVGPGFDAVAKKYAANADAQAYLAGKIKAGGAGSWGSIPMPPQPLADAELQAIAQWLASGAKP